MLQVNNVSLQYGSKKLFEDVNLKFTKGNCYGIIGANGAGKSTFLKILSGEIEPNKGEVTLDKTERMSVLQQNQNAYDNVTVLRAVMLGHKKLVQIMDEKDALYAKPDFSDEDGVRASELEGEFAELGGWDAEYEAQTLLNELDIPEECHHMLMADLDAKRKVKVLLAQALFGNPDVLLLDEPTNNLDIKTVRWLENYLLDFENTIIIVSHNRHFLNKVCTHICDVDYGKINMMLGNYDFWYQTNQLLARQQREINKKNEQRAKELQDFIARFAANASKSRQATSRKKELEKLTITDFKPSLRKYPYIDFKYEKELGNDILMVENLTKKGYFEDVSFTVQRGDKIGIVSDMSTTIHTHGQGPARRRNGKVGQDGDGVVFPRKQQRILPELRTHARAVAQPVFQRSLRGVPARLAGQDAVLGRGGAEAGKGALRRRKGALHAGKDDARGRQFPHFRRAYQPPGP